MKPVHRSILLAAGFCLLISMWVFRGIISGQDAPLASSYKNYEPWASTISEQEASRRESFVTDPTTESWPWAYYSHEYLRAGEFPLWNSGMFSGAPLVANRLTGLTNPLVLAPQAIWDSLTAFGLIYFIHFLLAGIFMWLFLKEMRIGNIAAFLGTTAYMLQGTYIPWAGICATDRAYFPMTMYFLERAMRRGDRSGIIGLIISLTLLTITGYPQFVVYSIYIIIAWILFTGSDGVKGAGRRALGLVLAFLVALLLGGLQHLLTAEFFANSARAGEQVREAIFARTPLERFDSPWTLVSLFFPQLWGDYINQTGYALPEYIVRLYNHAYGGIFAAFAVLFTPIVWCNRHARFFTVVFLICCLFIAWHQFFTAVAWIVPGLRISQVKPHFLTVTAMIIASSFVIDHIISRLRDDEKLQRRVARIGFWMLAATLGMGVVAIMGLFGIGLVTYYDNIRNLHMLLKFVILAIAFFILLRYAVGRLNLNTTGILLVVIALVDLVPYHAHFFTLVPRGNVIFNTPGIEFLQEKMETDGPFRIFRDRTKILPPNSPTLLGLDDMSGYDSMVLEGYADFFRSFDESMIVNPPRTIHAPSDTETYSKPFWDFLGVRYFLSPHEIDSFPVPWREAWTGEMWIYENTDWLPRWYMVGRVIPVESVENARETVHSINPHVEAVVEIGDGISIPDDLLDEAYENQEGDIEVIRYTANELRLRTDCGSNRLLVFSDVWYPGWRATIDGTETGLLRVNGLVKGVVVPSGSHEVRFLYDPATYRYGWILSMAGLVLMLLLVGPIRGFVASGHVKNSNPERIHT